MTINEHYDISFSSISVYPMLIDANVRILNYNGDTDAMVPYNGNLDNIRRLMKIINGTDYNNWHSWEDPLEG